LCDAGLNQKFVMNNVTGKTRRRARRDASRIAESRLRLRPKLSRAAARKMLDAFFEEVTEALVRGEPVKLRSFGSFKLRSKRERVGRNPKTGAEATISPRKVLTFKASSMLVARINGETINDEQE
jgi:integration host factor subunit alpha